MKSLLVLIASALSCFAGETALIDLKENDSAMLILDKVAANGKRPEVEIPASKSPGRVIVEQPEPDPNDWTGVRWIIRFDLSKAPASFRQARLHLWCQGTAGSPKTQPKLEIIDPANTDKIMPADRASEPLLPTATEIPFPSRPGMVELDVTAMVKEALKRKLSFAAFRISAISKEAIPKKGESPQYYFGGFSNIWSWPHSEPPLLEITSQ